MSPSPYAAAQRSGPFARLARAVAHATGHHWSFAAAAGIVVVWALLGPMFGFTDTWQLVINTGTTIVTFLMVFLIQSTQNRDTQALQIKLDELLRVTHGAHYALIDLQELTDSELELIRQRYLQLARSGRKRLRAGAEDTDAPSIDLDQLQGRPDAEERAAARDPALSGSGGDIR